jgi:uncharacterized protein
MDESILRKLIKEALESKPPINKFLWHGGEPTLAGLDFFKKVVQLQARYGPGEDSVKNFIQTNGTTLDDDWVNFLKDHKFHVGISLDGPKAIHDVYRRDKMNSGTFGSVMEGVRKLKDAGVPLGIVCAVTKQSLNKAEELLSFFTAMGLFRINFSPVADLSEEGRLLPYSVTPKEWGQFLVDLFDSWIKLDRKEVKIQPLDSLIRVCLKGSANLCVLRRDCGKFMSVDLNGEVYVCGRFLGNSNFSIGNLNSSSLCQIIKSERCENVVGRVTELPEECVCCEWCNVCNSGCAYYRFMNDSQRNRPYFCQAMKTIIPHLKTTFIGLGIKGKTIWDDGKES